MGEQIACLLSMYLSYLVLSCCQIQIIKFKLVNIFQQFISLLFEFK
jgi:hypothetical protein